MRAALVLRRDRTFGGHERFGHGLLSDHVSVQRGQSLARLLGPNVGLSAPVVPVSAPRGESVLLVIDAIVDLPLEGEKPLEFQLVQFGDGDIADFGPRFVLESVVVQKLATQQQCDG